MLSCSSLATNLQGKGKAVTAIFAVFKLEPLASKEAAVPLLGWYMKIG